MLTQDGSSGEEKLKSAGDGLAVARVLSQLPRLPSVLPREDRGEFEMPEHGK